MELTLDLTKQYTFADYLTWIDDKRRELIGGFIKRLAAPGRIHQTISGNIFLKYGQFLENKPCKVYAAPFDVRLPVSNEKDDKKIYNVVQPDIVVVCDPEKLDDKGCIGAPDLIVEITSKSTGKKDVKDKFELYQNTGVMEYWIVMPEPKIVQIFILDENQKYQLKGMFAEGDIISPGMFPDLKISVDDVFKD